MGDARERSSKERAERSEREGRSRNVEARAGPTLMAPGLSLEGIGNRALLALLRSGQLQRKARVSEPSDPREPAADRAADAVVSGARPAQLTDSRAHTPEFQRMPSEDEKVPAPADLGLIGPRAASLPPPDEPNAHSAHDLLGRLHGGRSLDEQTRSLMESRFGESFADVRIHTGHHAGEAADSLAARAFTLRQDIVFAEGTFAPETTEGKRLLAHELAHVVQQRRSEGPATSSGAATERDAREAARQVVGGAAAQVRERATPGAVQCDVIDENVKSLDRLGGGIAASSVESGTTTDGPNLSGLAETTTFRLKVFSQGTHGSIDSDTEIVLKIDPSLVKNVYSEGVKTKLPKPEHWVGVSLNFARKIKLTDAAGRHATVEIHGYVGIDYDTLLKQLKGKPEPPDFETLVRLKGSQGRIGFLLDSQPAGGREGLGGHVGREHTRLDAAVARHQRGVRLRAV
jgi:hypothetical protein